MELAIICLAAFIASGLTLFSGFGLGTLLMPVVAVFFPLEVAVAMTAVVHLANNLFKLLLLGRGADARVLVRFGIPAVLFAWIGAALLVDLSVGDAAIEYSLLGHVLSTSVLNLILGSLVLLFIVLELLPAMGRLSFDSKYLPLGGVLSGFFGGLSGHQGAFRSMFLIKANLSKEAFIATGVLIAVLVDMTRLLVYGIDLFSERQEIDWVVVAVASLSAFIGALLGRRLLKKITLRSVQLLVSAMLALIAIGLIFGLI
ncbi:MAG: sulfite exporter TauE/SafE family protein [Gammaproteobacteria bacterium]|nr:sulfite exporter TauE/SafE family protein [Gammaproteobacteria bacterium]MBT6481877.1 sulfite exporter TauE/SafE family protein [Gammaproteobacteria bacterium]MBT7227023.1 sulfite exporter TauE/SafE family protein [Gammaproteobacteria bacterium]